VIRIVANSLPDFVHPFAFILITSAVISSDSGRNRFLICLGWFALECFFEFGQHFKDSYLRFIPLWFDNIPVLQNAKGFFLNGTFDIWDLLSMFGGTIGAYWVLFVSSRGRKEE
jgi:Ca2+/Na+ antiporter